METNEEYAKRVNGLSDDELRELILDDACPYEPDRDGPTPMGMYHCPLCGEMVLAGCPHPKQPSEEDWEELRKLSQEVDDEEIF